MPVPRHWKGIPLLSVSRAPARIFYGWWVVIAGVVIYASLLGAYQAFGIFFKPIQAEFGWNRAVTATAFFIGSLTMAVLAPVVGGLSDRYGIRRVITAAGISGATGYALVSQVQTQWQLYACFVLMGTGGTFFVPLLSVVSRWFTLRRGLALGVTGIGGGIGQAFFPPLSQVLVDHFGWRQAYLVLAGILLLVVVSATQVLRSSPGEKGLLPYGETDVGRTKATERGRATPAAAPGLRQVIRTRVFWMLVTAAAAGHTAYQMTWVHFVPYVTDPGIGVSSMVGATLVSAIGWSNMAGKVFMGNLSDRIGPRATLAMCYGVAGAAMLWLIVARDLWTLYLFSFLLGFFYGGGIPLQPALAGSVFGLGALGAVSGGVQSGTSSGGAVGPVLGGYIYDVNGNYYLAFVVGSILLFISMTLVALVRKPKQAERKSVGPRRPSDSKARRN
ncbi:MAG: MFS transporter [Chloroflexi bacterium]|nr:MFS transporter [Chloroflexota bacterium]